MWQCRKCSKPVYFAERKQSLGFDWHPNCLRCEECGKCLNPGQHAEHKGVPYCHHPCYAALFGPQLFGHGTRNECHTSFGKVENRDGQIKRSHLESRLKLYNNFYEGKPGELKSREANGKLILEGVLRIYWGVKHIIHLKEEDDSRMIATRRQTSMPSNLDDPDYSDSDNEIGNTLWRDDSPNRTESYSIDMRNVYEDKHNNRTTVFDGKTISELPTPGSDKLSPVFGNYSELYIPNKLDLIPRREEYVLLSPDTTTVMLNSQREDSYDCHPMTPESGTQLLTPESDFLEPLLPNDSSYSESKQDDLLHCVRPPEGLQDNMECHYLGLSDNSECQLLINGNDTSDAHTSVSDNLEPFSNYSERSGTLTSSFSDTCGTLTSASNLEFMTPGSCIDTKPLLSDSTDYVSARDHLDHQTSTSSETSGPSTPYSDSSNPLSSSSSEPQTPLCDNTPLHIQVESASSATPQFNNNGNIATQRSVDSEETDHDCSSLSVNSTVPLFHDQLNGDFDMSSLSAEDRSQDSCVNMRHNDSNRRTSAKTGSTAIRRRPGRKMNKSRIKRRCSINGHYYLRETSSFTPPFGSPCSIWITSKTTAEEVLNMLLEKYKVEMSTYNFALYIVKDTGELRRIRDHESPLVTRVMLGPHEDVSKVFIMDSQRTQEVSHEVAQFLNLSLAECRAILTKFEQEEMKQIKAVRKKYEDIRYLIEKRMNELRGV